MTSKDVQTKVNNNMVEVKFKANKSEKMSNIWVEAGDTVGFMVSGKWKLGEEFEEVDSKGYENYKEGPRGFPIGALLGRVLYDDEYFLISDFFEFTPKVSGPLFLFMNSDVSLTREKPQGYLELVIKNAKSFEYNQIEEKLGWNPVALLSDPFKNRSDLSNLFSESEKKVFYIINKLRTNPQQFAKQYLSHLIKDSESIKILYDILLKASPMTILLPNKFLKNLSDELCTDLGMTGRFSHEDSQGMDLAERIQDMANDYNIPHVELENLIPKISENILLIEEKHSFSIVLKMLIDDLSPNCRDRSNLLDEDVKYIGISIRLHKKWGWICSQFFCKNDNNLSQF